MTLKPVQIQGWLKDVNDNFADLAPVGGVDGLGSLRVARFTFDTEAEDSAGADNTTVAVQALEVGKLTGYLYFVEGILSETPS